MSARRVINMQRESTLGRHIAGGGGGGRGAGEGGGGGRVGGKKRGGGGEGRENGRARGGIETEYEKEEDVDMRNRSPLDFSPEGKCQPRCPKLSHPPAGPLAVHSRIHLGL